MASFQAPNFSLSGQPGLTQNWADGILNARNDAKDRRRLEDRERASQEALAGATGPDGKVDFYSAVAGLMRAGNVQGATAAASMANNEADRDWRREEAERSQRNADRSYGLQVRTADRMEAGAGWDVRGIKNPDGSETLVRVNRTTGEYQPLGNGAGSGAGRPANPFYDGKFSSEQGKVAGFADRMAEAEGVLSSTQAAGQSRVDRAFGAIPFVGNEFVSEDFQKHDQAKRNFINSVLRRESGAVISQEEFANAEQQYFPQPGDSAATLAQKKQNRDTAFQSFARESGPNYTMPVQAPAGAINALRQNPALAQQFDAKYGQGASQRLLRGQR